MIPTIIHQVWLGGPIPPRFTPFMDTWRRLHPEWDYRLTTDGNRPHLGVNEGLFLAADVIAPKRVGQFRADLVRYELLRLHGGVYVDTDMEALHPIDELLDHADDCPLGLGSNDCECPGEPSCFFGWELEGTWINNAVIGAERGHPFIERLIAGISDNVRRRPGRAPNWLTGPKYVTPTWREHGRGVRIFPQSHFYPYSWNELERAGERFPTSYAVHHWDNQRKLRGMTL